MKKTQKTLLYSLFATATATAPLVLAISCGQASDVNTRGYYSEGLELGVTQSDFNVDQNTFKVDDSVLESAVEFLESHSSDYPILMGTYTDNMFQNDLDPKEIAKFPDVAISGIDLIKSITPNELREFSVNSKIAGSTPLEGYKKTRVMGEVQSFMLQLFYSKNTDANFNKGVVKYINNQALTIPGIDGGRGPWVSDRTAGGAPTYVNPNFHRAINDDALTVLQDSTTESNIPGNPNKVYSTYNTVGSTALQARYSDKASINGNTTNTIEGIATTLSLIRTKVSGGTFTSVLEGAESVEVGDGTTTAATVQKSGSLSDSTFVAALDDEDNNTLTFKIKPGTKYIDGTGAETKYVLKGRDFFLGFVHQLYTDQPTREEGSETYGLPPLSDDELKAMKAEYGEVAYEEYVNYNMYLYDLYGIDVKATIEANEALTEAQSTTDFIIKFRSGAPITATGLQFFTDSNVCAPVSSDKVKEQWGSETPDKTTNPGKYYGVTTYFPINQDGSSFKDISSWLSVSPYYYTSYNITPVTGKIAITKNEHYLDTSFATNPNTIKTYEINISPVQSDPASWAISRKNDFLSGKELVLDLQAAASKTITDSISASAPSFKQYTTPITKGYIGNITWNPFGYETGYNNLGREMMFGGYGDGIGDGSVRSTSSDFDAIPGFFDGNGAIVRSAVMSSINWFSVIQGYAPAAGKTYWQTPFAPDLDVFDGANKSTIYESGQVDDIYVKPTFTDSSLELSHIYNTNLGDRYEAMSTSKTIAASKALDDLATSVGATAKNPAIIPFQTYEFSDSVSAQTVQEINKLIYEQLNSLTPKVKFVRPVSQSWNDFMTTSRRQKYGVSLMHSFGKDYDGIGSIAQQYMTSYCTNSELDFVYQVLEAKN